MYGMQVIIYPTEHKWKADGRIALIWDGLENTSENVISTIIEHKDELGFIVDDVSKIRAMLLGIMYKDNYEINNYMELANIEPTTFNEWLID